MNPWISRAGNTRWIALLLAGMAIADTAAAQSLSFDPSAAVLNGGAPAIVKPRFQAGVTAVSRYHMVFGFPAGVFPTVQSTQCLANATCTVDMALHRVVVARASVAPAALSDEVACLLEFRGGGFLGAFPLQVVSAEFFDAADQPVAGTAVDGSVGVISGGGGPPTLDYVPAPDATCQANASDEVVFDDAPPPTFAAVDLTTSALGSPSGTLLSCSVGPGFAIVSGGEQAISSITPGVPIVLRCDQPAAGRGVLACTETSVSGTRPRIWDLACPRPVFADGMEAALR